MPQRPPPDDARPAPDLRRRIFLTVSGSAALAPTLGQATRPAPADDIAPAAYRFFNADEAAVIEAAVQRLIPPDALGPSALEAGVPAFIDRQLAGGWGAGERLYRDGPWAPGLPTQGYQLPLTPAQLFRTALRGLQDWLASRGQPGFVQLGGGAQDACLSALQKGGIDLAGVPSAVFFESLLGMTIEGYFCDPVYGGNRGMAAWQMIGFPGAQGAYLDWIDRHGLPYTAAPRSLGEAGGTPHSLHGPHAPPEAPGHHGQPG